MLRETRLRLVAFLTPGLDSFDAAPPERSTATSGAIYPKLRPSPRRRVRPMAATLLALSLLAWPAATTPAAGN